MELTITRLIALAGPSASGKTTLAHYLGRPTLELDNFYREGKDPAVPKTPRGTPNWELPGAFNFDEAISALTQIVVNGTAVIPVYDYRSTAIVGAQLFSVEGPVLTVLGVYSFDVVAGVGSRLGLGIQRVLLTTPSIVCAIRGVRRDLDEGRLPLGKALVKAVQVAKTARGYVRQYRHTADFAGTARQARRYLVSAETD